MERIEQRLGFEERVDRYITNKLAQDQINDLWVEVIEDKRKYEYLKTAAALTQYFSKDNTESLSSSEKKENQLRSSQRLKKIRNIAAAAGITLAVGVSSVYMYSVDSRQSLMPLSSLDYAVLRSAGDSDALLQVDRDIQSAIALAQSGQYDLAIHRLREVYESTQVNTLTKSEALINVGIIEYNKGDFQSAGQTFQLVIQKYPENIQLLERSAWYLAQSQLAAGDVSSARQTMQQVVEYGGAHSRAADRYLRYLR